MKFAIITDSSSDLKELPIKRDDAFFERIPLTLRIDSTDYVDTFDLDVENMVDAMENYKGKSTSSCPSPHDYYSAYKKAENIFVITITSALSGSYNSAKTAENMLKEEEPDKNILVIDSLATGPSLALIATKLAELINESDDFNYIASTIENYSKKVKLVFSLMSLDNLVKNGRVSKLVGTLTSVLGISVIGRASTEGTLEVISKSRGAKKTYQSMLNEMIHNNFSGGKVCISHCLNKDGANILKNLIKECFPDSSITIHTTCGLDSFYAQRGGLLVGYETL